MGAMAGFVRRRARAVTWESEGGASSRACACRGGGGASTRRVWVSKWRRVDDGEICVCQFGWWCLGGGQGAVPVSRTRVDCPSGTPKRPPEPPRRPLAPNPSRPNQPQPTPIRTIHGPSSPAYALSWGCGAFWALIRLSKGSLGETRARWLGSGVGEEGPGQAARRRRGGAEGRTRAGTRRHPAPEPVAGLEEGVQD